MILLKGMLMFQTCDTTDILIQNAQVLILILLNQTKNFTGH